MREQILSEIRRLADANGGTPPGQGTFTKETGIKRDEWRGVYWARWGDAVTEAGLTPNTAPVKIAEDEILRKIAEAYRELGKVLTLPEMRMYARNHKGFPAKPTIQRSFPDRATLLSSLADWVDANGGFPDVAAMLVGQPARQAVEQRQPIEGSVYLLRSGPHYKIGRSDQLERRVKEIRVQLPEAMVLVHTIRTDDPPGIEAYWHRRFADRRMNGEWFKLTPSDLAAFKRRRYQ